MRSTFRWIGMFLLAGLVSGCAQLFDPVDEALLGVQSCVHAKMAWHRNRRNFAGVCYPYHFGKGFRAGYQSVCLGGNGCPPSLPPREYWSVCHQSQAGRAQSVEWFNGFSEGALAAQMDGRDEFHEIVTSREATGQNCPLRTAYHLNAEQSTPYSSSELDELIGPPDNDWRDGIPSLGPPPAPHVTTDGFGTAPTGTGAPIKDTKPLGTPGDKQWPTSAPAPLPLPPLDETETPPFPNDPDIPDIDFHVESPPDGRPRGLVPTGFLSPEEQAGEQLGSRLNALWQKFL